MGLLKNGYTLANEDKLHRVLYGSVGKEGKLFGGLLQALNTNDPAEVPEDKLIVEYDKIGGLIMKGDLKVKTGCFWDALKKKAVEKPEVVFEDNIEGEIVEMTEAEAKSIKAAKKKTAELKSKNKKKAKKLNE